jgi:hypothetical protein
MVALIVKVIDFLRYARAGDLNGVGTQVCTWVSGVVVLLLVSQTEWAARMDIGGFPLSRLGFWSQVFYGLSAASVASVAKDTLKAVDNTNSAQIPTLLPTRRVVGQPPNADSRGVG